jgi:hypothetical protein
MFQKEMIVKSEVAKEFAVFASGFVMISIATIASIWAVKQSVRSNVGGISLEGIVPPRKLSVRRAR